MEYEDYSIKELKMLFWGIFLGTYIQTGKAEAVLNYPVRDIIAKLVDNDPQLAITLTAIGEESKQEYVARLHN